MNMNRFRAFPTAALAAAVITLLITGASTAFATAEEHVNDGLLVSKSWMTQIDNGSYDDSYAVASDSMHEKVQQDHWSIILKTMRGMWGPVVTRQQLSHVYKPDGFEGTEGEFLVITYGTSFKNLNEAKEVVVLRWEDGKWRAAGYNAAPAGASAVNIGDDSIPNPTEVQTQSNVRPTAQ
jgi:hypothetical protein